MLRTHMNVLDTVCVDHGHAFSRVDRSERVDEHVLTVAYEGCTCRRCFRGLYSYSSINQEGRTISTQFYETDDLDSVLEAVKAVHTVAIDVSAAARDGETVDAAARDARIAAAYAVISDYDQVTVDEIERTAAAVISIQRNVSGIARTHAIETVCATLAAAAAAIAAAALAVTAIAAAIAAVTSE